MGRATEHTGRLLGSHEGPIVSTERIVKNGHINGSAYGPVGSPKPKLNHPAHQGRIIAQQGIDAPCGQAPGGDHVIYGPRPHAVAPELKILDPRGGRDAPVVKAQAERLAVLELAGD